MHTSLQLAIGLFYASVTAFSPNSLSHQLSHPTYQSCTHPTITTTTNAPTTTTREQSKQYKSTHSKWKMNIFQDFITNQISKYDEKKESNRKFRTTVYGAADWRRHRSSGRHFAELRNMPFSNILRGVFPQSLSVTLFAGFICLYNRALELNPSLRAYLPLLAFPGLPFSLMSPSLGLLLVFRTNTAYSRWKDSRVAWSSISSKSFNLMRQASSYFNDKKCILDLIKYTVVFTTSVKWHLGSRSDQDELKEELNGILSRAELEDFLRAKNKPQKAILEITSIIKRAELISSIQSHMDKGVCELSDCFYVRYISIHIVFIVIVYTYILCRLYVCICVCM